jgi:hypothetical protein
MDGMVIAVTLFSLGLAAGMSFVAWRAARDEQRRLDEAVGAAVRQPDRARPRPSPRDVFEPPNQAALGPASAAVLLLLAALSGGAVAAFLMSQIDVGHAAASQVLDAAMPPALELVALEDTQLSGRLVVRGVVANRADRTSADPIAAVVQFFDAQGRPLTTARAPIDGALAPGASAPFSVAVAARGPQRYSVRFEVDGQIVTPVDGGKTVSPPRE